MLEDVSAYGQWAPFMEQESKKDYFKKLSDFVEKEYSGNQKTYPPKALIFNAFMQTPLSDLKVVIMGQDPYHGPGQAHGLSFSVCEGVKPPPSLKNIFKELANDQEFMGPMHGSLLSWAHQGVLLLNATLTVSDGSPKSHYGKGWEQFTDAAIDYISKLDQPVVYMLWGKSAQEKCLKSLKKPKKSQLVLQTTHPSPFSAHYGFLGSGHFSKANQFLKTCGVEPINWSLS